MLCKHDVDNVQTNSPYWKDGVIKSNKCAVDTVCMTPCCPTEIICNYLLGYPTWKLPVSHLMIKFRVYKNVIIMSSGFRLNQDI